jgi:hypothetical protein
VRGPRSAGEPGARGGAGAQAVEVSPAAAVSKGTLVARAVWGAGCLAAPAVVGRAMGLDSGDRRARLLLRVLGARDLGQALLAATAPPPALLRLGAGVDALHAASMVALAAVSPDHRRPALTSATLATIWAVAARSTA